MSVGVFTDKQNPPTIEQVLAALGASRPFWERLEDFILASYRTQQEIRYYGKSYGWALRIRKGGKALLSLYPRQEAFTVQVVLGDAEVQQALKQGTGTNTRQAIERANAYVEGRWLLIPVESEKDVEDIQRLLLLKVGSSKK